MNLTRLLSLASASLAIALSPHTLRAQETAAGARQLLPNPQFAEGLQGWIGSGGKPSDAAAHEQGKAVLLSGPAADSDRRYETLGVSLDAPPTMTTLDLRAHVRVDDDVDGALQLFGYAYGEDRQLLGMMQLKFVATTEWTPVHERYVLPEGAKRMAFFFVRRAPGGVFLSDTSMLVGDPAEKSTFVGVPPPSLRSSGVILAKAGTAVRGAEDGSGGVVTFRSPTATAARCR